MVISKHFFAIVKITGPNSVTEGHIDTDPNSVTEGQIDQDSARVGYVRLFVSHSDFSEDVQVTLKYYYSLSGVLVGNGKLRISGRFKV